MDRRSGRPLAVALLFICTASGLARAQASSSSSQDDGGFWSNWFKVSDKSKAEQPHWITPLATTTPRLEQEYRFDTQWQQAKPGTAYTENYGNTKGLELIPLENFEVILGITVYLVHQTTADDGFGDSKLLVKYLILSANAEHGDLFILTARS